MLQHKQILNLLDSYNKLDLHSVIDYDRFKEYAISHHSTAIEGSTLSLLDAELLLDKGITPKGKPFVHAQMVIDHHEALQYLLSLQKPFPIDVTVIQNINARVMAGTGAIHHTALGNFDSSKGELRRLNVRAGSRIFPNYDKVESLLKVFIATLNSSVNKTTVIIDQYELSFKAHFDLVSIHPFADGNGRTSRLLMNLVQKYFNLPLSIVFNEDKKEYITALEAARNAENILPFNNFMFAQLAKQLQQDIVQYNKRDKGLFLSLL